MDLAGISERRKRKKNEPIQLLQGICLKQQKLTGKQVLLNAFLRSFIVFSVVFGSVGGFLSAFHISYNYAVVAFFYLLLSVFASLLYTAPRLFYRDFGYILFFCVFIPLIYQLRAYANSGLYEIVNRILQEAETFFNLPGIVEYEVQIDNPYLTVSVLAVLVGMMEILVLNIWIYITMSIGWTVIITFPILLLPIYMKRSPDLFFVLLLGFGYLAVMIFKSNGHYMSFSGETRLRARGRKKDKLTYTQDAGMFGQVLAALLAVCLLTAGIVQEAAPQTKFESCFKSDTLRDSTSEVIGNVLMLGLGGMFNWYESTGGINGGRLGGVAGVRPDGQPDLLVSFTPYGNEAVYLKAFTGGRYGDNRWERLRIPEQESLKAEAERLEQDYADGGVYSARGKMTVKNVGADMHYLYYPYYTEHEPYPDDGRKYIVMSMGIGMQQEKTYTYYPLQDRSGLGQTRPADLDVSGVDEVFLEVPEKNREVLREQCEQMGLDAGMTQQELIDTVKTYFRENIPYTLRPGATPQGKDFVNYFLTKNRKGYCTHFASAATLLFRQMGMPARYVEGYVFSMETAFESDINETEQYADYYDGYAAMGESAVLDVEVTDAMAHAWVEVYMDGFGWCSVEVTPGSAEATDEDDFWSVFTTMLDNAANGDDGNGDRGPMLGDIDLPGFSWIFYVALAVVLSLFLWNAGALILRKARRYKAMNGQDEREALIARYVNVCEMERLVSKDFNACRSHMEQMCYFREKYGMVVSAQQIGELMEKISFSREKITDEERRQAAEVIGSIQDEIYRAAGLRQRMWLFMR